MGTHFGQDSPLAVQLAFGESSVIFADTPSPSLSKSLLKGEGSAAEWRHEAEEVWPSARVLSFLLTPPLPLAGVSIGVAVGEAVILAGTTSSSLSKRLLKGEWGCSRVTELSPAAEHTRARAGRVLPLPVHVQPRPAMLRGGGDEAGDVLRVGAGLVHAPDRRRRREFCHFADTPSFFFFFFMCILLLKHLLKGEWGAAE